MLKKKIILAVINDLTYDRRMGRICSALGDAGAEVTLIGRRWRNSKAFHAAKFKGYRLKCWFNKGPLFYAEYNLRLFFILLFMDADILCACDLDTAPAIRFAGWLKGKKAVYDAHEYFSEAPELTHRPKAKAVWEWIAKRTIPGFDVCYTVGEELATLMGRKFGVHFGVIRNIAPGSFEGGQPTVKIHQKKILLYQGALNVGRGLESCIEAMPYLPDWEFWLAGEGDITDRLKSLAHDKGIADRVHFLGWVDPDQLHDLMRQARLSINLREEGSLNDYYSLPNKFFDAIHVGLPSINMNYPEYARIISKYPCALLIDEVEIKEISRAVRYFDDHPEAWEAMSLACREASKEYNWENESQKLNDIYSKL